jgi:plastocyanin
MPWGSWINDLPTEFFLVVHITAFALGAGFAWLAFKRELALLGSAFSLFAAAELVYMTYHLDWTVFLFAHTIAEVLDLTAFVLVFAAAALFAAGCGGSGESSEPVATTEVQMVKSYRFDPKVIEIKTGDTVTWTNEDNFTHTVEVDGQEDHKVGQGESFSIKFDEPGTHHYVCTLHSKDMDGEVIVK